MSSDYQVLCLTHDPALEIGEDRWENSPNDALAAANDPKTHDLLVGHTGCDLVVGRYSAPLVEVACPPTVYAQNRNTIPIGHHNYHVNPMWIDVEWLRLLWHAQQALGHPGLAKAAEDAGRMCWPPSRVHRLRYAIGALAWAETTTSCCPACDALRLENA